MARERGIGWGEEGTQAEGKGPARRQGIGSKESLARGQDQNGVRDIDGSRGPHWVHGQRLVKSSRNGKDAVLEWAALGRGEATS